MRRLNHCLGHWAIVSDPEEWWVDGVRPTFPGHLCGATTMGNLISLLGCSRWPLDYWYASGRMIKCGKCSPQQGPPGWLHNHQNFLFGKYFDGYKCQKISFFRKIWWLKMSKNFLFQKHLIIKNAKKLKKTSFGNILMAKMSKKLPFLEIFWQVKWWKNFLFGHCLSKPIGVPKHW